MNSAIVACWSDSITDRLDHECDLSFFSVISDANAYKATLSFCGGKGPSEMMPATYDRRG